MGLAERELRPERDCDCEPERDKLRGESANCTNDDWEGGRGKELVFVGVGAAT